MDDLEKYSLVTCPKCGYVESEEMPTDHSTRFYACKGCSVVIVPKLQDCCVFCSYGSSPCLSAQKKRRYREGLSGVATNRLTERRLCPPLKHSRE